MDRTIAEHIVDAANEIGITVTMYENYSGRGMFGRTTIGLVCNDLIELFRPVALAAARISEAENDAQPEDDTQLERNAMRLDDFIDNLNFRTDNMGRDMIVY